MITKILQLKNLVNQIKNKRELEGAMDQAGKRAPPFSLSCHALHPSLLVVDELDHYSCRFVAVVRAVSSVTLWQVLALQQCWLEPSVGRGSKAQLSVYQVTQAECDTRRCRPYQSHRLRGLQGGEDTSNSSRHQGKGKSLQKKLLDFFGLRALVEE